MTASKHKVSDLQTKLAEEVFPKFSVVIPCFNESDGLPELVAKCDLVATIGNGEFIFVNNGSTDNSGEVLAKLLLNNKRLRFITVSVNQGYGYGITSGLKEAKASIVGWTHSDLQCEPGDVLRAIEAFTDQAPHPFVKGKRYGRPMVDRIFTAGMSIFETVIMGKILMDINAQPTLFDRVLMEQWSEPPKDFSLDLFAFAQAKKNNFKIFRIPVIFAPRRYGQSNWNFSMKSKWKFIKRTLKFSFQLRTGR
jgi:glycosyltransferase involved in cell wall biosynthesis